jgi:hypothetical protein
MASCRSLFHSTFAGVRVHARAIRREAREMIDAGRDRRRAARIDGRDPLKVYRSYVGIIRIMRRSEGR